MIVIFSMSACTSPGGTVDEQARDVAPDTGDVPWIDAAPDSPGDDSSADLHDGDVGAELGDAPSDPTDADLPDLEPVDASEDLDAADVPPEVNDVPDAPDLPDTPDVPDVSEEPEPNEAETTEGRIRGAVLNDGVLRFLGIPYAEPPLGALRWRAPRPPAVRPDRLEATEFGPACPQPDNSWVIQQGLERDEDCLNLNVWAPPRSEELAPVMVWIHGGGYLLGSGAEPQFDGAALAADGAMVVTLNHRLGAFGFMAHEALLDPEDGGQPSLGNYALLDVLQALRWLRANAAAFGGDPERITVFGESAGGISACALLASPLSEGLLHGVIMQSAFCQFEIARLREPTELLGPAVGAGALLAEAIGCTEGDVAACLRAAPADAVVDAVRTVGEDRAALGPVVDGHVLHDSPREIIRTGRGARVPMIAGTVADEGTVFLASTQIDDEDAYHRFLNETFTDVVTPFILVLYPARDFDTPWHAAAAVMGDFLFTCPTREALRAHVGAGNPGWLYFFGHVTREGRNRGIGAYHASEVPFIFGTHDDPGPEADQVSATVRALWTSFAAAGRPTADGVVWPPYSFRVDPVLEIDADPEIHELWRDDRCRFWAGGD